MYKITHNKISNQWEVSKGKVYITCFDNAEEAHDYVQRCVEDDRWNRANRG